MEKEIWKFKLSTRGNQEIELPLDYEILSLQTQKEIPCIWMLVNPSNPKIKQTFELYGTGRSINYYKGIDREYIGTYQEGGGNLVWHLFKRM